MQLFYKLRRLKLDIVLHLMISTAHFISVQSHVCMLVKRPDPSRGGTLRWSLPKDEICRCQRVVAPNVMPACSGRDEYEAGELWFVDDPRPLTRRSNWREDILDDLLQRTELCDVVDPRFETCPLDKTTSTDPGKPTAMVVWDEPKASDNSGKVTVSCNYNPGTHFPIGYALVRCTALAESGNTEQCHFTVSVEDNEKPEFEICPPNITIDADPGLPIAVVVWTKPKARDNAGIVVIWCSYISGVNFNIGDTLVSCRAVDGSGNKNECYFIVSVRDFDECMTENHTCSANAACVNTDGGYNCSCNQGYEGDGFECVDINECQNGGNNCDVNAGCTNTEGSYTCACDAGYSGNGVTCNDINECQGGGYNCSENAGCTNTAGSYTCVCNTGYSGNGVTCNDINECQDGGNNCAYNAGCNNTDGSYTCACNAGYSGDGINCNDINECQNGGNNCDVNAGCNNTEGSFTCACNAGYSGNGVICCDFTAFTVRLSGGSHCREGRVEILHGGVWGTVCHDSFYTASAQVVCRQLGYPSLNAVAKWSAYFGEGSEPTWLDNVACTGSESRLEDCAHRGWRIENCSHRDDVGVVCG